MRGQITTEAPRHGEILVFWKRSTPSLSFSQFSGFGSSFSLGFWCYHLVATGVGEYAPVIAGGYRTLNWASKT